MRRIALLVVAVSAIGAPPALADAPDGAALFRKSCMTCHGVQSAGIRARIKSGGDLGGLADRMDADALRAVATATNTQGRKHKAFKGTDEELEAMIAWLLAQPAE